MSILDALPSATVKWVFLQENVFPTKKPQALPWSSWAGSWTGQELLSALPPQGAWGSQSPPTCHPTLPFQPLLGASPAFWALEKCSWGGEFLSMLRSPLPGTRAVLESPRAFWSICSPATAFLLRLTQASTSNGQSCFILPPFPVPLPCILLLLLSPSYFWTVSIWTFSYLHKMGWGRTTGHLQACSCSSPPQRSSHRLFLPQLVTIASDLGKTLKLRCVVANWNSLKQGWQWKKWTKVLHSLP